MKKVETYISPWYQETLDWAIRDIDPIFDIKLFKILQKWIIYHDWYFAFEFFKSRFFSDEEVIFSPNDKIYHEFSMNKFYIDDYILSSKNTSLRFRAFLWKIFVDTLTQYLLWKFPEKSFVILAIIDKQRTSFVSVTFYSIFDWYTPVIEEPFSETGNNYLYISKISFD